jgi:hypothetical protein
MENTLMAKTRSFVLSLLILTLCSASTLLRAQVTAKGFLIDPNRPYVYLKFDHIGPGVSIREDEPRARIWLRFTNNCSLPIFVRMFGSRIGSEEWVEDRIVANEPPMGVGMLSDGTITPKIWKKATPDELPRDYSSEVGGLHSIAPGEALLFSLPINHVSERWHFEIPFEFGLPKGRVPRDPNVGGVAGNVRCLLYRGHTTGA